MEVPEIVTNVLATIGHWLDTANGVLWGPPMLILLLGTHLYLTIRLRLIQRFIAVALRLSVTRDTDGQGDVSQFGALMTALAATIGTGNIVGVGTAIVSGGPGAVFWMWVTGVLGFATKYAEGLLAVRYRVVNADGQMSGGPMYALERGLGMKWLAVAFAAFTMIAGFGIGNMVQANSVANFTSQHLQAPGWMTGLVLAVLTGVVVLGGIKRIAVACELLVPFMAIFYVLGCVTLLVMKADTLPATIALIVSSALGGQAVVGGLIGYGVQQAMRFGVARGLFSNESGLGSAPIVAAAAQTRNPVRQALVSATGTFWDTVVICALTGMMIVNSAFAPGFLQMKSLWPAVLPLAAVSGLDSVTMGTVLVDALKIGGGQLSSAAFSELGAFGPWILFVGLITFVFSTILGWCYYGEKATEYLVGLRGVRIYRWLWVVAVFIGATVKLQLVWDFADAANAMMAIPNLVALLLLAPVLVAETDRYLWRGDLAALASSEPIGAADTPTGVALADPPAGGDG